MATEEQYKQALIKAHNAGDKQAAELFARKIKELRNSQDNVTPGQFGQGLTQQMTKSGSEIPSGNLSDAVVEPLKAISGSIAGSVYGGWKGIAELISSGNIDSAVSALKQTQQEFASMPETQAGRQGLQQVTRALETLERGVNTAMGGTAGLANLALQPSQGIEGAKREAAAVSQGGASAIGQEAFEKTGSPLVATVAEMAPDLAGLIGASKIGKVIDGAPSQQAASLPQDALVSAGKQFDVPLLTTDVFQPTSYLGRWVSGKSDQLGALGSGSARVSQQQARVNMLEGLASEFNVAIDSPFFEQIVKSLSSKNAKTLERGNIQRRKAIEKLDQYGEVDFSNTQKAVNDVIEKEMRLGEKANQSVINEANTYLDSLRGKSFDDAAAIRTRLIQQQKDLEGSTVASKTPMITAVNSIKKAIDDDLNSFAKSNDRDAAAQWLRANRSLAEQLGEVKQTELARMIKKGEATPEVVSTILKGGKRSELQRLARNLGSEGRAAARAAIVKQMFDDAGGFRPDEGVNVNKFTTELAKTKNRQAIDVLFSENQKIQLDAMERLLEATRRAQDAAVNTKTGQELVPLGAFSVAGYGLNVSPITTLALAGTTSAALKAYESKPMRELLMKIARTKKGSAEEKRILESAIPAVLAAQMAAKEQQQIDLVAER